MVGFEIFFDLSTEISSSLKSGKASVGWLPLIRVAINLMNISAGFCFETKRVGSPFGLNWFGIAEIAEDG